LCFSADKSINTSCLINPYNTVPLPFLVCCLQLYASLAGFAADMISGGTMLLMAPANQATNTNTNASVPASNGFTLPAAAAAAAGVGNSSSSSSSFWLVPMGEADNAAAAGLVPVTY
jgi:hypothetical protein